MRVKQGRVLLWLLAFWVALALPTHLYASADAEREELARLLHEIRYLETLLLQAKLRKDTDARRRFNYEALAHDISQIAQGIADHLNTERREPRTLPELQGEYTDNGR